MPAGAERARRRSCTTGSSEALEGVDVVMLLRIQRERLEGALVPSMREYSRNFGVSQRAPRARAARARSSCTPAR